MRPRAVNGLALSFWLGWAAPAVAADTAAPADAVDYTRDTPPAARSWAPASPGHADRVGEAGGDAETGEVGPEAAVAREERTLVRALVRMILVLVGVVLAMLVLARGARHLQTRLPGWVGGATPGPQRLQVVERLNLSPKHTLAWVERDDGAAFLVAFGEGGTSLLGPMAPTSRHSFAATMAEVTDEPRPPRDTPPPAVG